MKKRERHRLYKEMLANCERTENKGFCQLLERLGHCTPGYYDDLRSLPELRKQKPQAAGSYWWPARNWKSRKEALQKAIKMSEPLFKFL